MTIFQDRREAGKALAEKLANYTNKSDVLILALPRGGVPVAFEISKKLRVPLDIFIVRKLGIPGNEEVAMGAIATGGIRIINQEVLDILDITQAAIDQVTHDELIEMRRREKHYRGNKPEPVITGKTIIIVDDGLATGSTMKAAVTAIKRQNPEKIIIAVPVSDKKVCENFKKLVDDVICVDTPLYFKAVGQSYNDFSQITDKEVINLLEQAQVFTSISKGIF